LQPSVKILRKSLSTLLLYDRNDLFEHVLLLLVGPFTERENSGGLEYRFFFIRVVLSKVLRQPYLEVAVGVEPEHALVNVELSNFGVAVVEPAYGLAQQVEGVSEREGWQVG
jgi:hypothetical protein